MKTQRYTISVSENGNGYAYTTDNPHGMFCLAEDVEKLETKLREEIDKLNRLMGDFYGENKNLREEREFPRPAIHKSFGKVILLGVRVECESNGNTMYFVKHRGDYYWIYDYETELLTKTPEK